jgi:predicted amidohydrolase YtcJ
MFTLFYNGNIHTLDNPPLCSALLVHNNQIIFCGNENEINLPVTEVKKINLAGYSVLPSFIDCHTHFAMAAKKIDKISLDHCRTFEETIQEIKDNIRRFRKGTWIKGSGWNANLWSGLIPDKTHLDSISIDHPIALFNKDLHTLWLNSTAFNLCGFHSEIPAGLKNKILLGDDGKPNGLVIEDACKIVEQKSKDSSSENNEHYFIKLSEKLLKAGITTVNSMENLDDFEQFIKLNRNKKLKTRICFHPPGEEINTIVKAKIYSGFGNEWLRFGGLKYYVDGSLGSQTAEMFENFEGLNHAGVEILSQQDLAQKIIFAASKGLSATIHAIGDKANHKTLNAIEGSINKAKSPVTLQHRIEHSQIINKIDIKRFNELNTIASMQPLHIADDIKISDKYLGDRAKNAYPINSLIQSGAKVVFGSDTPVADFNPFMGMQAAISRRYNLDPNEDSWYPNQNISIAQAINCYAKDAAYASYEETIKGSLQPGKLADFVILSEDLLKSNNPEETLKTVEVVGTILDGRIEYINDNYDILV